MCLASSAWILIGTSAAVGLAAKKRNNPWSWDAVPTSGPRELSEAESAEYEAVLLERMRETGYALVGGE